MSKTLKISITVVIAIALVMIGYQASTKQKSENTEKATLKIGAILPLSGDFASFGEEIDRGAQIAVDEARQNGIDIVYINEDDHSEATGSVNAANKLVYTDKVDVAFTATVQEVKPAAPVFNSSNTPLIAVWDSNDFIKNAGPNIYTTGFGTEAAGQKMARHAYTALGIKKVAIIPQTDDWSKLIASAFEKEFIALGGTIVMNEEAANTQKDFRTLIAKVKGSGAEGIYAPFLPQAGGPLLKQSRELGYTGSIMMADSFSQADVAIAGSSAEGIYFTNLYADNTKNLIAKYKIKYGSDPYDPVFVSFGYDVIKTIIAAHQKALTDKISINQALLYTDILGTGTRINFNGNRYSERLERLYQVQNGQFIEIK